MGEEARGGKPPGEKVEGEVEKEGEVEMKEEVKAEGQEGPKAVVTGAGTATPFGLGEGGGGGGGGEVTEKAKGRFRGVSRVRFEEEGTPTEVAEEDEVTRSMPVQKGTKGNEGNGEPQVRGRPVAPGGGGGGGEAAKVEKLRSQSVGRVGGKMTVESTQVVTVGELPEFMGWLMGQPNYKGNTMGAFTGDRVEVTYWMEETGEEVEDVFAARYRAMWDKRPRKDGKAGYDGKGLFRGGGEGGDGAGGTGAGSSGSVPVPLSPTSPADEGGVGGVRNRRKVEGHGRRGGHGGHLRRGGGRRTRSRRRVRSRRRRAGHGRLRGGGGGTPRRLRRPRLPWSRLRGMQTRVGGSCCAR